MEMNFIAISVASIVPLAMGFVWYNPKVLGTAWLKSAGVTEESMKGANMGLIFGLSFLFSIMLAFTLQPMVIHQFGLFSMLENQPGMHDNPITNTDFLTMMAKYGTNFRTVKHGILHGVLLGVFFVLPVLGTNALFERKGFKYIFINVGYWTLSFAIMGAILSAWI
ncbi:MAG: hypothetical protein RLZZ175_729 [Bacteroidota bacterium]|jgi:hypothetical protein